jgi:hypothetical protein
MRQPLLRPAVLAIGLAAAAVTAPAASPTAATAATRADRSPSVRPVLLINGDRFLPEPSAAGGHALGMLPTLDDGSLIRVRLGGLDEVIPSEAAPYLGRGLAPSLFDVSALEHAETAGRLRVQVSFSGRAPALPGVTMTRSGRGSGDGYLTAASARAFGAALRRQFLADQRRGSYGRDGLFADGVSISLAGTTAATTARPDFPMHTLTVTATNLHGQPDTGDMVVLTNLDDPDVMGSGQGFSTFYHGSARYSVPAGQYWVVGIFFGPGKAERWVVQPQFTVSGKHAAVHLAERSATSRLTVAVPRPVPAADTIWTMTLIRGGRHGATDSLGTIGSGTKFWINSTAAKPTVGTLQWYSYLQLISPKKTPGIPYAYNLDFAAPPGLLPSLHYRVRPASLATVTERYYQERPTTGMWSTAGAFPAQAAVSSGAFFFPLPLPGQQIQYMSASPGIIWESQDLEFAKDFSGGAADANHELRAGQRLTENWNEFPLHPQPNVSLLHGRLARLSPFPVIPSALRTGSTLSLAATPFSDNQFGHIGFADFSPGATGRYTVKADGITLASGNALQPIPPLHLRAKRGTITFSLAATLPASLYPQSRSTSTTWTWRTAPRPGAVVPAGWACGPVVHGKVPPRSCAVQPMLTLGYHVRGLEFDGSTRSGRQVIGLTVGQLQLAPASAITSATAQVSLDDGMTWKPATVTSAGPGRYRIAFTAPAGTYVALRVSAADAAGGTVAETIMRAYRTGSANPASRRTR